MEEENHPEKHSKKKTERLTEKFRENPWILSTFVLGIIVLLFVLGSSSMTGNISKVSAGEKLLSFYEANGADGLELQSVEDISGIYQVNFNYQGSPVTIYATKDLKYAGSMSALPDEEDSEETEVEVAKSDKPFVGLYIWSYCPYGVTALTPFSEVASLLENSADFKVYLYYAGHGEFEVQQNKIQACMQELGEENYWDYAEGFATDIYSKCSGDINCDKTESIKLMKSLGIDSNAVMTCVDSKGDSLLEEDYASAQSFGVTGSPSLVINGEKVSVARTAEAYKTAVCSAFNDAPEACNQELDSTGSTASGNC